MTQTGKLIVAGAAGTNSSTGFNWWVASFEADNPPTASFTVAPGAPSVGDAVTLDGSGSSDSDGTIKRYDWDLDGDGEFDDASGVTTFTSFATAGSHNVGLRVTDDVGAQGTSVLAVPVACGTPPATPRSTAGSRDCRRASMRRCRRGRRDKLATALSTARRSSRPPRPPGPEDREEEPDQGRQADRQVHGRRPEGKEDHSRGPSDGAPRRRQGRQERPQAAQEAELSARPTILLFDVDGTLVDAGGAGRRAIARVFGERYGRPDAFDGVRFHGLTDRAIVRDGLGRIGLTCDEPAIDRVCADYLEALAEEMPRSDRFRILPGSSSLLESLAGRPGVAVGLGTGNLREGARLKLERARLFHHAFRGFGCDHEDRATMPDRSRAWRAPTRPSLGDLPRRRDRRHTARRRGSARHQRGIVGGRDRRRLRGRAARRRRRGRTRTHASRRLAGSPELARDRRAALPSCR